MLCRSNTLCRSRDIIFYIYISEITVSASIRMKSVIRITQKKNPDLIRINPDPDPGQKIRIETGIRIRSYINFLLNYSIFVILHITRYIEPLALRI